MKSFCNWWKEDKRYITFAKSLLLALLPFVCCLIYCASQGYRLSDVYLPSSEWNDELFYYKQVQEIVVHGYPKGYFGFNESHALKLSFAAWSPVLVFPWIIWGVLFGWNFMSPILCNIILMAFTCFLYGWLVKPAWKQLGILLLLFSLYTPFVRYMLSGMPECICFSMLVIFYSLSINYLHKKSAFKLFLLFLLSGIMTLMRPYLILFMLLPSWLWIHWDKEKLRNWKRVVGSLAVPAAVLGLYACIKHYLGAEYFAPLFFTDWVSAFFEQGVFGGLSYTLKKLYHMGQDFASHTWQGFSYGLASGAIFASYLVCACVLALQSIHDWNIWRKLHRQENVRNAQGLEAPEKDSAFVRNRLLIEGHLLFSFIAMFFALLLMYKLTEGSKHLLTFMAAAIFVIPLMETRFYRKAVLVGVTFAYFFSYMARNPYDYQVPFVQEERIAALEEWRGKFSEELVLEQNQTPNYENVVIWVFYDTMNGTTLNTQWQLLYALPEGFGISCCMPDYIIEHFDSLQSRYLFVQRGGQVEDRCLKSGYEKIAEDETAVLFKVSHRE